MSTRRPFVGGNWKMNTNSDVARTLATEIAKAVSGERLDDGVDIAVFPPFVYLREVYTTLREHVSGVKLGAQDVYHKPDGAFTGEVSIDQLKDCGVHVVLTGHSERRHVLNEPDGLIRDKTHAVLEAGLECILCVGETLEQRESGQTDEVNARQTRSALEGLGSDYMDRLTIAYEPVWAIGTGKTATPQDAQDAHAKIRSLVGEMFSGRVADGLRIQYGGSVKPGNAAELFAQPDIDGGLIGGASLTHEDFLGILRAAAGSAQR